MTSELTKGNWANIEKIRDITRNLLAIPASEQGIGHFQMAVKSALEQVVEELERINKILGIYRP